MQARAILLISRGRKLAASSNFRASARQLWLPTSAPQPARTVARSRRLLSEQPARIPSHPTPRPTFPVGSHLNNLRQKLTPHAILGHSANAFHLAAYMVQDIFQLRLLGIIGTTMGMAYNYGHKTGTLWLPVAWGFVFALINGYRIVELYLRDAVTFTNEELETFDDIFAEHQFKPRQFHTLLAMSYERFISPGEVLTVQGTLNEGELMIVLDGNGRATRSAAKQKLISHAVARGSLIGDVAFAKSTGDIHQYTIKAGERGLRLLVLPFAKLRAAMDEDKLLALAINRIMRRKLSAEYAAVLNQTGKQKLKTYERMIQCTCVNDHVPAAAKQILRRYREANGITPEQHQQCLNKIGWTVQDFADGGRGAPLVAALGVAFNALKERGVLFSDREQDVYAGDQSDTDDDNDSDDEGGGDALDSTNAIDVVESNSKPEKGGNEHGGGRRNLVG